MTLFIVRSIGLHSQNQFALSILLSPLRVSKWQEEALPLWKASKQNTPDFLICSTGFRRQLEETFADETKRPCCCQWRCIMGRTDRWRTDQTRWNRSSQEYFYSCGKHMDRTVINEEKCAWNVVDLSENHCKRLSLSYVVFVPTLLC